MSSTAVKNCRSAAKAYEALAEAFQQVNNLPKLKAQVNAGSDLWAEVSLMFTKRLALDAQLRVSIRNMFCLFQRTALTQGVGRKHGTR